MDGYIWCTEKRYIMLVKYNTFFFRFFWTFISGWVFLEFKTSLFLFFFKSLPNLISLFFLICLQKAHCLFSYFVLNKIPIFISFFYFHERFCQLIYSESIWFCPKYSRSCMVYVFCRNINTNKSSIHFFCNHTCCSRSNKWI